MTEKFDPRFDPRFQPGYQGEPGETVGVDEAIAMTEVADAEHLADSGQLADAGELVDTEHGVDEEREPNPFERTLWVVAAILVVGGVALAYWANSLNFRGGGSDWTWPLMIQSSMWALSGPMVTVGLATAVGLLFRRAITWKPPE